MKQLLSNDINFVINGKLFDNPVRQLKKTNLDCPALTPLVNLDVHQQHTLSQKAHSTITGWKNKFSFREEKKYNDIITDKGLRTPQIGAVHAIIAHWKVNLTPATVVMPTGTGKTETMLAITVAEQLDRVLVIVPSDALRDQVTKKYLSLGLLRKIGVVNKNAPLPVIGTLEHAINSVEDIETYFKSCNVIVATINVVNACSIEVQKAMAENTSHLFIDEAHHIPATSWREFRRLFLKKTILQFTATPFRRDSKPIEGDIIYNYPLKKAQEEDYFKQISFIGIREYYDKHKADVLIARKALDQLASDIKNGFNHIIMARCNNISRAKEVFNIYQHLADEHKPVLMFHKQSTSYKKNAIMQLNNGTSRIVVCVDMFGEGFDLPELKIAAMHDIHKSLAITLQFVGRFTRVKHNIGNATVIANVANSEVEEAIRTLYMEDADWNNLLKDLSEGATKKQKRNSDFIQGFSELPEKLLIQNILPKMSTVVYKTNCAEWSPNKISKVVKESKIYIDPTINQEYKTMFYITCERESVSWGEIKSLQDIVWDLYLFHWDKKSQLLYINSSNNGSLHYEVAKAVCGESVQIIKDEDNFKCLVGIKRLVLMNLGLTHARNKAVSFTMYIGADIIQALADADQHNRLKSTLFGRGFENGNKTSIGCSSKGRLWSHKICRDIPEWIEWCHSIGKKITDPNASVDDLLKYVLRPTQITQKPDLTPINIEWSEEFLQNSEESVFINIDGEITPLYEAEIRLSHHNKDIPIRFTVSSEKKSSEYQINFIENGVEYIPLSEHTTSIQKGRKNITLSEWFSTDSPVVRFENESHLRYNLLFVNPVTHVIPFNKDKIIPWDWEHTLITNESQTPAKEQDSIQYKVIQNLVHSQKNYSVVFNDDSSGEAADIITLKINDEKLYLEFFHCKYSEEATAGARIGDLYEVCGQAQRSIHYRDNLAKLLEHIYIREIAYKKKYGISRFEKGGLESIDELRHLVQYIDDIEFKITVVQPGVSKKQISDEQLKLLSATENYLKDTFSVEFEVICSE